jgi:ABC-type Fe3+-hydroxamate transport system substrate-binding protein
VTDFSVLYQDIRNFGTIFDARKSADAMVSKIQNTIAGVQAKIGNAPGPKVFTYSFEDGGRGRAYRTGNQSIMNAAIIQAGGKTSSTTSTHSMRTSAGRPSPTGTPT